MTKIRYKLRPVWHETHALDSITGRAFLVAETPSNLLLRLKGTRQVLSLPWSMAYLRGAVLAASIARLDKINKKRARNTVKRGTV